MAADRDALGRRLLETGISADWIEDPGLRILFETLLRRRNVLGRLVHLAEVSGVLVGTGTDANTAEMAAGHVGHCLSALYLTQLPPEAVCERLQTRYYDRTALEMQERYLKERTRDGIGPQGAIENLRKSMDRFISSSGNLPRITNMRTQIGSNTPHARPDVWDGILRHGDKLFLGAPSKAAKTFTLMSFAAATSAGVEFWGRATRKTNVLYVNFELHADTFARRLETIRQAMGLPESAFEGFDHWGLRGHVTSLDTLAPEIVSRARGRAGLIVLDPIYKALGDRDENSAGDITSLCNLIESICRRADASVAVALHFAKGNAGGKSAIDRISGSGVFARDPDAHLTMTPHEQDGAYVVSATLRDHPCPGDWCVQWEYPLMRLAPDLDPEKVRKQAKASTAATTLDILDAVADGRSYATSEIIEAVRAKIGASAGSVRAQVKD
ncbi:MAG: helicase RepA family protein, partial [Nitrospira sp.]|nr:helicase RepA family protein [Nitrospira sp.]